MSNVSQGPAHTPTECADRRRKLEGRVRADLWKALWEADQVMSFDEIRDHVEATLREIQSDRP